MDFFPIFRYDAKDPRSKGRAMIESFWRLWPSASKTPGLDPETYSAELLFTPPFKDCRENQILDTRYEPATALECKDRSKLLAELGNALHADFQYRRLEIVAPEEMRSHTTKALAFLSTLCDCVEDLHRRDLLSESAQLQIRGVKPKKLENAGRLLARILSSLTDSDYALYGQAVKQSIVQRSAASCMRTLLEQYGPSSCFSDRARYHAIASILIAMEFEQGDTPTVAARLLKREQRAHARPTS